MRRGFILKLVGIVVGLGVLLVLGIWAYIRWDAGPDTASKDIQDVAPTLAFSDLPEQALFRIIPEESTARFRINEILLGEDLEVVGTTSDVAGDVIIDYQNPAASTVGTIAINARTLQTPVDERNMSIRSQILETRENEFIFFHPTSLINAPSEPVLVGNSADFQIEGDLEIKGVKNSVIFDVTITAVAEDEISGFGTVTVEYADWDITINAPPSVAGIEDTVILEIEFKATQVIEEATDTAPESD